MRRNWEARGAGAGLPGRLRVSAATTFARLMIVPHLREFMTSHPSLDIDVVLDDRVIDLVSEGIDIALRLGTLADSAVARKIASGGRSVVATPAYLACAGTPKLPADLAHHHAVVYSQLGDNWVFRKGGEEVSVAVRGRLRVSAAEGLRAAVLADMGLAVASDRMFVPELASGAVQCVLPQWKLPPIDLWAVFPTGRLVSAKARALADFVEETSGTMYAST
jgi:DNA-binding transcriptional LysR family regulator